MFRIAICEDDNIQMTILNNLINEYANKKKVKIYIKQYKDPISILADELIFDIYLLDIILPGDINGIKLGKLIKSQDTKAKIIYVSSDSSYAIEAYKSRALYYLLKPVDKEELFELLDQLYEETKKNRAIIKTANGTYRIATDELTYVNIGRRNLLYHLKNGDVIEGLVIRVNFELEIGDLIKNQDFCFLRPSLLVNLNEIDFINKTEITFKNKEKIKISAPQAKSLLKAWGENCIQLN